MLLERHAVEPTCGIVSVGLRLPSGAYFSLARGAEHLAFDFVAEGRTLEPAADWIDDELPFWASERRTEVERGIRAATQVAGTAHGQLRIATVPRLIFEDIATDANRRIELRQERSGQRREEQCRGLVADETLAIDDDLVALREPAENRMIVEDEALARLVRALEKQGGRQPADAAAHDHVVNVLVWSYAVHADLHEEGRRSHECRVEKVSPCDSLVHSQQPSRSHGPLWFGNHCSAVGTLTCS